MSGTTPTPSGATPIDFVAQVGGAELRRVRGEAAAVAGRWDAVAGQLEALGRASTHWLEAVTFDNKVQAARDEAKRLRELISGIDALLSHPVFAGGAAGLGVVPAIAWAAGAAAIAVIGGVGIYTIPDALKVIAESEEKVASFEAQAATFKDLSALIAKEPDPVKRAALIESAVKVARNVGVPVDNGGWPWWVWALIAAALLVGGGAVVKAVAAHG